MDEKEFVGMIARMGGRAFIVGGWVRDRLRGVEPHDKDYMVSGVAEESFVQAFPKAKRVGKSFPVYLIDIDGNPREVAFARKEKKAGSGYRGFSAIHDDSITVEEDLYRRDTKMNSMALELPDERLIDPFGGRDDIEKRQISATSGHFSDDPVRALRAARQAAQFGFSISDATVDLMRACRDELAREPAERLYQELSRVLDTDRPSVFFLWLRKAGLLQVTFPEIHALIGKTQPVEYHLEGDAFNHTMKVVDAVAAETEDRLARFAALVHDIGKGTTPEDMLPHHYGHAKRGLDVLDRWNQRMTLPRTMLEAGWFVIREHMRAPLIKKEGKQAALLLAIDRSVISLEGFDAVICADHGSLPDYLAHGEEYTALMKTVDGRQAPPSLKGAAIGRWIAEQQARLYHEARKREASGEGWERA